MKNISNFIKSISKRPGMYVGKPDLRLVSTFLYGYCFGCTESGEEDPLISWGNWIEQKFLISHPAWHWTRILLHEYGEEDTVLEMLPVLYNEYFEMVNKIGVEGINKLLNDRFIQHFGTNVHKPKVTTTKVDF